MKKHLLLIASFFTLIAATQAQSTRIKWKQLESGLSGQVLIVGTDGNGHWVTNPFVLTADSTVKYVTPYQFSQGNGYRVTAGSFNTGTGTQTLTLQNGQTITWGMDGRYILSSSRSAANGVAPLGADGKVPDAFLPPQHLAEPFVVNSQAAMLALSSAAKGDFAIRTDSNITYVLKQTPATAYSNWVLLPQSAGIQTINGKTGPNASITSDDVPEGAANFYATAARVRPFFSASALIGYNQSTGAFTHATSGVTADTYNRVTVDVYGHVVAASNVAYLTSADLSGYYTKTQLQTGGQAAVAWGNIQGVPSNLGSQDELQTAPSGTSSVITLTQTPIAPTKVLVFLNGVKLEPVEYSISGTTLTLGFTPESTDKISYAFRY